MVVAAATTAVVAAVRASTSTVAAAVVVGPRGSTRLALENTTVGESVTNTGKGTAVVAVTGVSAATSAQVITPTTVSLYCGSTGTGCPASSAATCATLYDLASSSDCTYVTQSCGSSSSAMAVPSGASSATFYAYGGGGGSGMDENEYPDGAAAVFPAGGAGSKVSIATSVTNGATYYANVGCGGAAAGETGCSSSNGDGYCNSSSTSGGAGWAAGGPGGTGKYELKSTTHATDGYSGAGGGASAVCTISCSSAASPLIVGAGGGGGAEEVDDLVNAGAGGAADGGSGYLGASVYTGGTGATATTISTTNSHCTSSAYTCWDAGGAGGGGGYQGGTSGAAGLPLSCNSISTSGCPSTSTSITVPASNPGGGYGGQSYAAAGGTISAGAGASGGTTTGTSAATGANGYVLVVWTFTTSATAYCTSTSCPSAATCQSITGVSNCDVTTNASESCSANGFTIVPPSSPVAASSGTFYTFGGGGGSGLDENEFADGSAAAYPPGGAGSKAISGAVTVNSGTDFSGNIGCGGGAEGESCTVDGDCTNGTISGGTGWASGGAGAVGTYRLKTTTDSSDGNSGGGGGATGACVETSTPTASCSSSGMDAMEVVAAGGGGGAEEVDSSINTGTGGTADAGSGYEGSSTYTGAAGTTATTISTNGSNSKCTTTTYTCWDAGGGGGGGGYPGGTGGTAGLPLSCNSISTSGCPSTSTQITVPTANPTGGSGGESNGSTVTAGGGAAGGASSGTTAPVGKNGYIIVVWNYAESTVVSLYCDGTGSSACPASSAATCATWAGLPAASDCNYYSSTSTYACGDSFAITPPAGFTTGTVDVYGGGGGDGTDMFGTYDGSGASYPNGGNGSVESTTITNTTYYGDIGCGGAGGTQSCLPVGNAAGCPSSTPTTTAGYAPGGSGGQGYYNCYDYIFIICPQNTDGNAGAGGGASALCTATCITGSTPLVVAAGGGGGSELTAGKFYTSAVNGTPADDSANTYGSSVSNGTSVPPGTFPNYPPYLIWNAAGGGGGGGYQYGVGQNYATNGLSEVTCIFNGCNANSPTSPNGGIQSPGGGGGQSFPATGSGLTAGGGASGGTGGSGSVNGSNGYIVVYWGGTPGHAAESTPPVHYATCAGGSTWTTLTAGSGGGSNVIPAGTTNFTLGGAAGAIGQDGLSTPGSGQEVQVSVPLTVGQQVTYDTGCSGYGGIGGQGYDATTVTLNLSGGNSGTTFQTSVSGTQTTADENGQGGGGGAATILCLGNSCSTTALCTSAAYALQPTLPCIVAVAAGGGGAGTTSIEESAGQSVNPSCSPTGGNGGDATTVTVANGRGSPGTAGGAGSGVAPGGATEVSLTSGGTGTSATAASVTDPITGWGLVSSGGGGGGIDGGGASSSSTCSGGGGGSSWWWSGTGSLLTSLNSATGFLTYNSFSYDVYATQQTKLGDTSWAS